MLHGSPHRHRAGPGSQTHQSRSGPPFNGLGQRTVRGIRQKFGGTFHGKNNLLIIQSLHRSAAIRNLRHHGKHVGTVGVKIHSIFPIQSQTDFFRSPGRADFMPGHHLAAYQAFRHQFHRPLLA